MKESGERNNFSTASENTSKISKEDSESGEIKVKQSPVSNKPEQTVILAEKFQQDRSFLNEALAKYQPNTDISKKFQLAPISDIHSAINLNDKFIYIKELFHDDHILFKETIEKLNHFSSFNEAVAYIDHHFDWDFDDFQVQKILELVHRRYQSDKA